MAKSANRGAGPGTHDRGGVRTTMSSPFGGASKGSQGTLNAPFNAPRTGGDNGLPTKIYDGLGGPKNPGKGQAAQTSSPGTIMTKRSGQR